MNRPKPIEGSRDELIREGFRWIETRKCKICGSFIEIWHTPACSRVALEVRPDQEWKLLPHVYLCAGVRKPKPETPQTEMFE